MPIREVAPIPVKYPFQYSFLDSRLPGDSLFFLTAYNYGQESRRLKECILNFDVEEVFK